MTFLANDTFESSEYYVLRCMNYIISQLFIGAHKTNVSNSNLEVKQRILFVISHPDDECMFFGPTILNLARYSGKNIFLLCLSYGDFYQKGNLRKYELWKSCSILGIPESNIFLQKVSALPDNPNVVWDENIVYHLILNYVEKFQFDAVVTFDKEGVSGHSNHIAVYYALAQAVANQTFPSYCSVYCLDSVNKLRKYSFIFDFIFSICFSSNWFILPPSDSYVVKSALMAHETQYVWFRRIYIWISRYAYINTYTQLNANEAMFDISYRDVGI